MLKYLKFTQKFTKGKLLEKMVGEPIFFLVVFLIQMGIAVVNYVAAYACKRNNQSLGYISNLLAGISWTLTGLYKLGEYFLAIQTPL